MPLFSLIIPLENDVNLFHDTVASVLRYRPPNSQIILVHDGTYVDPYDLGADVEFVETTRRKQLIRLFNAGVREARGEIVAFFRPGIEVQEDWHVPIAESFESGSVGAVSPRIISPHKRRKIVATGVNKELGFCRQLVDSNPASKTSQRNRVKPIGPTSWAAFYRKSMLEQIGSCDDLLDPVYLDLDLALVSQTLGYSFVHRPDCEVSILRATPIFKEAASAHGRSAERAIRRHSNEVSFGRTLMTVTAELIKSPLRPWYLQHAIQRFSANRMADIDRHFAEKISRAVRQREWTTDSESVVRKAA